MVSRDRRERVGLWAEKTILISGQLKPLLAASKLLRAFQIVVMEIAAAAVGAAERADNLERRIEVLESQLAVRKAQASRARKTKPSSGRKKGAAGVLASKP